MKTIIVYSTKYGCVQKVASTLKSKIPEKVKLCNLSKEKPNDIDSYDNIIIGGSIYIGKIRKDISKFIECNIEKLMTKNIGLFICAAADDKVELDKELNQAFPDKLNKHAKVRKALGYEINYSQMKFLDRLIIKKVKGVTEDISNINEENINKFVHKLL